jgi:hypothetical protein
MKANPKEYYVYETPKIAILWNGKRQPVGLFKSIVDALSIVEKMEQTRNFEKWEIETPDNTFRVTELLK